MCTPCDKCLGKLTEGTVLILQDETSHVIDNWKAVAAIDGVEYYSEGESAAIALRRVMAKVEDIDADMASDEGRSVQSAPRRAEAVIKPGTAGKTSPALDQGALLGQRLA